MNYVQYTPGSAFDKQSKIGSHKFGKQKHRKWRICCLLTGGPAAIAGATTTGSRTSASWASLLLMLALLLTLTMLLLRLMMPTILLLLLLLLVLLLLPVLLGLQKGLQGIHAQAGTKKGIVIIMLDARDGQTTDELASL